MPNQTFEVGMLFNDHLEFKEAIREYKIKWGYPLFLVKNESGRVRHKCENCEWEIYASTNKELGSLQVKTFKNVHSCARKYYGRMVTAKWVAMRYIEKFRSNPQMTLADIMNGVRDVFQDEISIDKAYRARQIVLEVLQGRFKN
jgi:hypothetical protein